MSAVSAARPSRFKLREMQFGVILVLPALAMMLAIVIYPLIAALGTSLFSQSLVRPGRSFVGLENFARILAGDFWDVLGTTVIFTAGATIAPFVIGFAAALALNTGLPGQGLLRGAFLLPWVIPGVVTSFIWMWIFNANYGLLNGVLVDLGIIDQPQAWLANPASAMVAVIIAKTWATFPWIMVMMLAGLQTVPADQLESALIDGAGTVQRFLWVVLPQLSGIIGIVLLLEVIWNFQHFDMIYVLTQGGPGDATTTFAVSVYSTAFKGFNLGTAGAMGALWMLVLTVLVVVYIAISERRSA